MLSDEQIQHSELHGFSDAWENAYAAVVYLLNSLHQGSSQHVAKTKVAPLKRQSIPRLELRGEHLLTKLITQIRNSFHIDLDYTFAWSDSTIVLHWLDGSPKRFKTFVGNRVSSILDLLPARTWQHVPTATNPADCASHGLLLQELILHNLWWKELNLHNLWWKGPPWLQTELPQSLLQPLSSPNIGKSELKTVCNAITTTSPEWIEDRFSSFTTLCRVTAWMFTFINNIRARKKQCSCILSHSFSTDELKSAEFLLYHISQCRHFSDELRRLSTGEPLKTSSHLSALNPTIGSGGLLMVGGRSRNSSLSQSQKHPIILHAKPLLVLSKHLSFRYSSPTLLLSILGSTYHIIGAK